MTLFAFKAALEWGKLLGWNPTNDAETTYTSDPRNYIARYNEANQLISIILTITYDDDEESHSVKKIGNIGYFITDPNLRHSGIGKQLLEEAIAKLTAQGCHRIGLNSVPEQIPFYSRYHFKSAEDICHFDGIYKKETPTLSYGAQISPYNPNHFKALLAYDAAITGANRKKVLRLLFENSAVTTILSLEDKQITGYAMARPCIKGNYMVSLHANDIRIAKALVYSILRLLPEAESPFYIYTPKNNISALHAYFNLTQDYSSTVNRMYRNDEEDLSLAESNNRTHGVLALEVT